MEVMLAIRHWQKHLDSISFANLNKMSYF